MHGKTIYIENIPKREKISSNIRILRRVLPFPSQFALHGERFPKISIKFFPNCEKKPNLLQGKLPLDYGIENWIR